jgi:hypothetical protein
VDNIKDSKDDQVQIPLRRDRARDEIELELGDEPPACKMTRTQNEAIGWRPGELELVGAYHPGVEGVHMDPELRNVLLLLLQKCYDYRDGEFERDASIGEWKEGEGPLDWQERPLPGRPQRRRNMHPT